MPFCTPEALGHLEAWILEAIPRRALVLLVALATTTGLVPATVCASATAGSSPGAQADCDPHPPISVSADSPGQGFAVDTPASNPDSPVLEDEVEPVLREIEPVLDETELDQPDAVPRPGSGVVAGNGTAGNPYVIEGWCIEPTPAEAATILQADEAGIRLEDTRAHVVIRNNTIQGTPDLRTLGEEFDEGVSLENARNVTLVHNTIEGHQVDAVSVLDGSENVTVEDNLLRNNGDEGFEIKRSGPALVRDNRIEANGDDGGFLLEATEATVEANRFAGNGDEGLDVNGSSDLEVRDNAFLDNQNTGVLLYDGTRDAVLAGNEIRGHEFDGVLALEGSLGLRLDGNALEANGDDGFDVQRSPGAVIRDNRIASNGGDGGYLEEADSVTVEANTFEANDDEGLDVNGADDVDIRGNGFLANNNTGVLTYNQATGATITGNTMKGHGFDGALVLDGSDDVRFAHNTIEANDDDGIDVHESQRPTIEANDVRDNGDNGLEIGASNGVEVHQNNLVGHPDTGLVVFDATQQADARGNWWGSSDGPSGRETDACTGAVADGSGDAVFGVSLPICFDPWRSQANPDAGAS